MREEAEKTIWQLRELLDVLEDAVDVPDLDGKRRKLHGVVKVLEQMAAARIPIPEEITKLKAELLDEIGVADEAQQTLNYLQNEFAAVIERVGHPNKRGARRRRMDEAAGLPTTSRERLRESILESLRAMGGSAKSGDVLDEMAIRLKSELQAGDMQQRSSGELVWRNNARWERNRMVEAGILRRDSARGMWELK